MCQTNPLFDAVVWVLSAHEIHQILKIPWSKRLSGTSLLRQIGPMVIVLLPLLEKFGPGWHSTQILGPYWSPRRNRGCFSFRNLRFQIEKRRDKSPGATRETQNEKGATLPSAGTKLSHLKTEILRSVRTASLKKIDEREPCGHNHVWTLIKVGSSKPLNILDGISWHGTRTTISHEKVRPWLFLPYHTLVWRSSSHCDLQYAKSEQPV